MSRGADRPGSSRSHAGPAERAIFSGPFGAFGPLGVVAKCLDGNHAAARGEPPWPPVALIKAMLIAVWYDLSDVKWTCSEKVEGS
jgi:hypothetical protein